MPVVSRMRSVTTFRSYSSSVRACHDSVLLLPNNFRKVAVNLKRYLQTLFRPAYHIT